MRSYHAADLHLRFHKVDFLNTYIANGWKPVDRFCHDVAHV